MPSWSETQTTQTWYKKQIYQHIVEHKNQWFMIILKEDFFFTKCFEENPYPQYINAWQNTSSSVAVVRKANAFGQE